MDNDDDEEEACPLCMQNLDETDVSFFACPCQYQVCLFCVHYIMEQMNGKCPACRQDYTESQFVYDASRAKRYRERQADKRKGTKEKKEEKSREEQERDMRARHAEKLKGKGGRRDLADVRVIQRNVVHVIGLTSNIAKADLLRSKDFFGQYAQQGKLLRVTVSKFPMQSKTPGSATSVPIYSAYLTFEKPDDALSAIQAVDGFTVDGQTLRASFGTSKYCRKFLDGEKCERKDCNFLHKYVDENGYEKGSGKGKSGKDGKDRRDVANAQSSKGGGHPSGKGGASQLNGAATSTGPEPSFEDEAAPATSTQAAQDWQSQGQTQMPEREEEVPQSPAEPSRGASLQHPSRPSTKAPSSEPTLPSNFEASVSPSTAPPTAPPTRPPAMSPTFAAPSHPPLIPAAANVPEVKLPVTLPSGPPPQGPPPNSSPPLPAPPSAPPPQVTASTVKSPAFAPPTQSPSIQSKAPSQPPSQPPSQAPSKAPVGPTSAPPRKAPLEPPRPSTPPPLQAPTNAPFAAPMTPPPQGVRDIAISAPPAHSAEAAVAAAALVSPSSASRAPAYAPPSFAPTTTPPPGNVGFPVPPGEALIERIRPSPLKAPAFDPPTFAPSASPPSRDAGFPATLIEASCDRARPTSLLVSDLFGALANPEVGGSLPSAPPSLTSTEALLRSSAAATNYPPPSQAPNLSAASLQAARYDATRAAYLEQLTRSAYLEQDRSGYGQYNGSYSAASKPPPGSFENHNSHPSNAPLWPPDFSLGGTEEQSHPSTKRRDAGDRRPSEEEVSRDGLELLQSLLPNTRISVKRHSGPPSSPPLAPASQSLLLQQAAAAAATATSASYGGLRPNMGQASPYGVPPHLAHLLGAHQLAGLNPAAASNAVFGALSSAYGAPPGTLYDLQTAAATASSKHSPLMQPQHPPGGWQPTLRSPLSSLAQSASSLEDLLQALPPAHRPGPLSSSGHDRPVQPGLMPQGYSSNGPSGQDRHYSGGKGRWKG